MTDWTQIAHSAALAAEKYQKVVVQRAHQIVAPDGRVDGEIAYCEQRLLHSVAWIATTVKAIGAVAVWAESSQSNKSFTEVDELVLRIGLGEYFSQLVGGIPMGQGEISRPRELGILVHTHDLESDPDVSKFLNEGNVAVTRQALVDLLLAGSRPTETFDDETLDMVRDQFRAFTADKITPFAHAWHLSDTLIPNDTIIALAELGVFGICIPAEYGGLGLGKLAMSVVSEELSRGWICAGSLGTRSEIAGELISSGGTELQKAYWLPRLASGETLPTAVFTEPDTGSDLASVRTRARLVDDQWIINGSKSWITHAARADLMTLLVRTDTNGANHAGLSMLLAPKQRGTRARDFPDTGLEGSEIAVLGYRGMKEYILAFDEFKVPSEGLLGGVSGQGFRQLMSTFESARIQTAARAIGVAWNALDVAFRYASERKQFSRPIIHFPRVSDKLAMMIAETIMARELTYMSAKAKDAGRRCDVEAGMAKLLAARVAWSNADMCVQIHGGNGYALEYEASRILCDARVLNIFEGAAEIQAQVVGRGLLSMLI